MNILFFILFWLVYFFVWISLFLLNFMIFSKTSKLNVWKEILEDHNIALWSIIRWQFIGQAIMIWTLIYFLWTTLDKMIIDWKFIINNFLINIADIFIFGLVWIMMFQLVIFVISKVISLEKEIVIDQNESIWKIIEWILIWTSIILSLSIYSY